MPQPREQAAIGSDVNLSPQLFDLFVRKKRSPATTGASSADVFPVAGPGEIAIPEGKGATLPRTDWVNTTRSGKWVKEHTITVWTLDEAPLAVRFPDKPGDKLVHVHFEVLSDPGDFFIVDIYEPRLARAAVTAACARKMQTRRVPSFFFPHSPQTSGFY